MGNEWLANPDVEFEALCTDFSGPSIPPERLIRASLIQILFSVRSALQLKEQMQHNLLIRQHMVLCVDNAVWVQTVFTKNHDRLMPTKMLRKVMAAMPAFRLVAPLLSDEHFSVDGTLIKVCSSIRASGRRLQRAI